jgi:adenylate cyclase
MAISISDILDVARRIQSDTLKLRERESIAVMFVDMAGSTTFKETHPDEIVWLPRLAYFLAGVSAIMKEHGRIVKYIGDEVMGVFEGPSGLVAAQHAIDLILEFASDVGVEAVEPFEVKIAVDYGQVTLVDFGAGEGDAGHIGDPQGTVVDRCARIAAQCRSGWVLASEAFVKASRFRERWKKCGSFRARGLKGRVTVFELVRNGRVLGCVLTDSDRTLAQVLSENEVLRGKLEEANKLLAL